MRKLTKNVQILISLVYFLSLPSLFFVPFVLSLLFVCRFLFLSFRFCFANSLGHYQSDVPIRKDGMFLSSLFPDSFFANSSVSDVLHSNTSLQRNWWFLFHAMNFASESDPAHVTTHEEGNASPVMNDVFPRTTIKNRFVTLQVPGAMRVDFESDSNKIDESDMHCKKHAEQKI
jgi:hypothetical protein